MRKVVISSSSIWLLGTHSALKDRELFGVALECFSLQECEEKKEKFKGFISFREKREESAVFDMRGLFNKAKAELTKKNPAIVKGFRFYRIKTDPRMVRLIPI